MVAIVVRRLALLVPILLGISMLTFGVMHLIPGDAATLLIGTDGVQDPVALANIRHEYGLDKPLVVQYGLWLGKVLQGDFGRSIQLRVSVLNEIMRRVPLTVELAVYSTIYACILGGTLGTLSAARGGFWRWAARGFTLAGVAVPNFVVATFIILFATRYIPFIPALQYVSLRDDPRQHLLGLIYPVITLGTSLAAVIAENTQASVAETLDHEYVRVGRAKGLAERTVLLRHVLRNALIPIITITGLQAAALLGGTIITETIFALPGLGLLAYSAIILRDYPLMQGIVLTVATLVVLTNLLADITYTLVDPRVRTG